MGFREELDAILENTPETKQTLLFSATMPDGVRRIASNYLHNPKEIAIGKKNTGAINVEHHYYVVRAADRYEALKRIADFNPKIYAIIFCRTRYETKEVASKLIDDGYSADALHGDMSQGQRDFVMQRFRSKQLQLLVATDVAARGLDINNLTHIINYNLPENPEIYIHRSGRTGRAGKKGISIIISHTRETSKIRQLERLIGKKFEKKLVPSGEQICEKRLYNLTDKIENTIVDEEKIAPYLPAIMKKLQWLDRDELIKRLVYVEFERFLDYYKNAKDLNAKQSKRHEKDKSDNYKERKQRRNRQFVNLYINIGAKNHLKAQNLLVLVNQFTDSNSIEIGRIDIQRNFSFFEVQDGQQESVVNAFRDKNYGGTELIVEISANDKRKRGSSKGQKRRKR